MAPCGCGRVKRASFGYPGEKAVCCSKCKKDEMVDVKHPMCACGTQPVFGLPDDKRATCCAKCKTPGMIDIKNRRCVCGKGPHFGLPDDKRATCCAKCKTPGMIDIKNRRCACGKSQPTFGLPDDEQPTCCAKCKTLGMINIKSRRCACGTYPVFGLPDDEQPTCCATCKTPEMIDIKSRRCACGTRPSFGLPDDEQPTCCAKCKTPSMINIKSRRCVCGKSQPVFGLPDDERATCCAKCKTPGMIDIVNQFCPGSACQGNRQIGTHGNSKYDGYCTACFANDFPNDPRTLSIRKHTWELQVRDFLTINYPGQFIHDQPLWTGECNCTHRRRIDFRKLVGNTLLCIEVDEREHNDRDQYDEEIRYDDLFMIHGGKFVFIRINPHPYSINGVRMNPSMDERLNKLREEICKQSQRINTAGWETSDVLVDIVKLYYTIM